MALDKRNRDEAAGCALKFIDGDGEIVGWQAYELIREIRAESKGGAPNYGSEGVSTTLVVPAGVRFAGLDDVEDAARYLQAQCDERVRERIKERERLWNEKLVNQNDPPPPSPEIDPETQLPVRDVNDDLEAPRQAPVVIPQPGQAPQSAPRDTAEYPLLPFMTAANRSPGNRYRVEVSEYEVTGDKIAFFGPGSQYAKLTTYTDRKAFDEGGPFNGWKPAATERQPMPTRILTIEVLDKLVGNPPKWYDQRVIAVVEVMP